MNYYYSDLVNVGQDDLKIGKFVQGAINNFVTTDLYTTAKIADDYDRGLNTTITAYEKTIRDIAGRSMRDPFSATHRGASNFYHIFTSQLVQYLLSNGIIWHNKDTEKRLGYKFSNTLARLVKCALDGSVAYGYFNLDHLEILPVYSRTSPCFCPITDNETGTLRAGIGFWRYDKKSPLHATLYTEDGITEYLFSSKSGTVIGDEWQRLDDATYYKPRKPYQNINIKIPATGEEINDGANYSTLPIIPLYANYQRQSEIVSLREKIDAYDFILNGFADDLDNAQIYWIIRGAGGMDDPSLSEFLDRLRTVGAAAPEDGQDVQAITVNIPVDARERLLDRLEAQLYKDAQAFNPNDVKSGSTVTAQIDAAYEPLNLKANELEYCILDFVYALLEMLGIKDEPTFTRDKLSNTDDKIRTLITAAPYLSKDYITEKILLILGDGDKTNDVLDQIAAEERDRNGFDNELEGGENVNV